MNIFQPRAGISILRMRKSVASAKCVDFITPSSYPSAPPPPPPPPPKKKKFFFLAELFNDFEHLRTQNSTNQGSQLS